jgi:predicted small secreted protein
LDVTYHARIGFRRCGTSLPQLSSDPLGTNKMQLNSAEENMTIISNLAEFRLATIFTLLVVCSPNLLSSCNTNSPQKNIGRSIVSGGWSIYFDDSILVASPGNLHRGD